MKFKRKTFFDGFRSRIDATIESEQVGGLEFLLGEMEVDPFWKDVRHIAYALATAGHETAWSFQPVEEGYYLGSAARVKAFQKTLRYYPYYGRGYVQLTWEKNYKKAGDAINLDLVNKPQLALEKHGAYATLTYGMHQGWFTGKKLTDYIFGNKCDYKNARRIINGTDKAALIAGYATQFERILNDSIISAAPATITKPTHGEKLEVRTKPDEPASEPPIISQEPVIEVESVVAEPESKVDTTITKWSSRFVAIPAAALTGLGAVGSWLTSTPEGITVTLIIAGSVIAVIYFLVRMIMTSRDKARKDQLQAEREARAHELQLRTLDAASDPAKNTVRIVSPPTVEIPNSDSTEKA